MPVRQLGAWLPVRLYDRLALVEPGLEGLSQLLAGNAEVEPGAPRLELDEANVVVAFAVAPCIALGLAQRAQPHEGTVLLAPDSVKNPQAGCG